MSEENENENENKTPDTMGDKAAPVGDTGMSDAKVAAIEEHAKSELPKASEEELAKQKEIRDAGPLVSAQVPDILLPGYGYEGITFPQLCHKLSAKDLSTIKRYAEFHGIGIDEDKPTVEAWVMRKYNEFIVKYVYDEEMALKKFSRIFIQDIRDTKVSF